MADTTAQMQELERQNGALDPANPHNTLADHTLSDLTHELTLAQLDELKAKNAGIAATTYIAKLKKQGVDTDEVDGDMLGMSPEAEARLPSDIVILRQALQQTHYLPSHPTYRLMADRLQHLELTQARVLQNRAEVAAQRTRDLAEAVNTARVEASKANAASFKYARLQTDLNNDQKRKEAIATRMAQVNETRALGMLDIEMLEPARVETKPSHPSKKTTLPMSLVLGMVVGCGLGFLRDRRDDRYRTLEEIRIAMGVPLLGTIPQMPAMMTAPQAGRQSQLAPASAIAEACRTIRTAIQFGAPKERCRTMLVTSPSPSDGKSTLASNLAITMAQSGKHVLLMDADLRLPTQHTVFNVRSDDGLSTILQGMATLDQAIQPSGIERLDILPCGPLPNSPTELLNSPTFADLLETLADRYDQVVIDSPPVTGIADARIIAAAADMTVLVLRADKSTRRASEMARDGLGSVGAQLLGVVVNDITAAPGDGYSYHGYRSGPARGAVAHVARTQLD
jgi:polysaccharide biosynthesis transport protein